MLRFLIISLLIFFSELIYSQNADFISIKKRNGITVKSFYAGSIITLETKDKLFVHGVVKKIANDSLFVLWYDVRTVPTRYGVNMLDTIAAYVNKVHYNDIAWVSLNKKKAGIIGILQKMLVIGSGGYIVLKTFNSLRDGQPLFKTKNLTEYGIAFGVLGSTILASKLFANKSFSHKKYKIIYVKL